MQGQLRSTLAAAILDLFGVEIRPELTRPEEQFGDYATNVALKLAQQLHKNPQDIGQALATKLRQSLEGKLSEVSIKGPGFLNIKLSDASLLEGLVITPKTIFAGQEILVEFGDPNPFKAMHLGHLYTAIVGDAIARLLEFGGANVKLLSYHGDVGMHVAKAIWAIQKQLNSSEKMPLADVFDTDKSIGRYYSEGTKAFEDDPGAAEEIRQVNAHVYARDDAQINHIYEAGCALSFSYFDKVFKNLGITFDKRYLESQSTKQGLSTVTANVGKVFAKSDGAIIYRGEKIGLHTRVFVNSKGLPTYEAKDLGLAQLKNQDFPHAAQSLIITAHEQAEYFKVMLAALAEIDPLLAQKTHHIAHGFLSLASGKMSSRKGNIHTATDLLDSVLAAVHRQFPALDKQTDVYLAAVKYSFLKNRLGGDIVFDVEESVALVGNSGPYLQYTHARARSILGKAKLEPDNHTQALQPAERSLARKISEYSEVVDKAIAELMPHHICSYLYELAQNFNSFYEHNRVVEDPRQALRLVLVKSYADVLESGLQLLNIPTPDHL